jgi:hypothetical protein
MSMGSLQIFIDRFDDHLSLFWSTYFFFKYVSYLKFNFPFQGQAEGQAEDNTPGSARHHLANTANNVKKIPMTDTISMWITKSWLFLSAFSFFC